MSYIGNPIISTDFPKDTFSGNGSTTAFTMSIAPASVNAVIVVVSGITQDPSTYTISGTTLTFSAAPPTGTDNISVRHLGVAGIPNTPSAGSVVATSIADGVITAAKFASGQTPSFNGITFPATQSASADANTLDDYEEGTWTATIVCDSGSVTQNYSTSVYTKIGRLVTVSGYLEMSSVSSPTGKMRITLPFSTGSGAQFESTSCFAFNSVVSANIVDFAGVVNSGSSSFDIFTGSGVSLTATSANQMKAGTSFRFSATYMTA